MEYYLLDVHFAPKSNHQIAFFTFDKAIYDEYKAKCVEFDKEADNLATSDAIGNAYTKRVMWIVFGDKTKSIHRITVEADDSNALQHMVDQIRQLSIELKSKR